MLRHTISLLVFLLSFHGYSQNPWINEIHYDNNSTDVNEGIEIAGPAGTNLACYNLIAYNGSGGASYITLVLSGILPDEGCGYGALWFPMLNLQNGSPDGIALYNTCTATQISLLSYEGVFAATSAPFAGVNSTDLGVVEIGTTPLAQSLQLIGSGNTSAAFSWTGPVAMSMGTLNAGQTISPCGANTITTGIVSGGPFTVECTTSTTDAGSVAFTSSGVFGIGNIYSVQLSDAAGSFAAPTVIGSLASIANIGVINFTIPSATPTGAGYLIRIVSDNPAITGSSSAAISISQTTPCPPYSITTGVISTAPFTVDCTAPTTDAGSVAFTSTGIFGAGNIYTVQLSDAAGSFAAPTSIGTLASVANSGSINFTIPAATPTGAAYRLRIVSDNPVVAGASTPVFTITQTMPCVMQTPVTPGLIINEWSNGPAGNQEYYEFVVAGQCGTLVDIRGYILDDNNGTFTTPASYSGTASGIAPGHFRFAYDPQWAAIPVGSLIVIYNNEDPNPMLPVDDPTDANTDSLYVVPHDNALFERCTTMPGISDPDSLYSPCTYAVSPFSGWGPLSIRNAGDAIQIRNIDGSYYHGVSYGGTEISGGPHNLKLFTGSGTAMAGWFSAGDFFDMANWSSGGVAGNETPGIPNNTANEEWLQLMRDMNAATCPIVILPVELADFDGKKMEGANVLHWETANENNSSYFTLERSVDMKTWEVIDMEAAAGFSQAKITYSFVDFSYRDGIINYYRLSQTDIDGSTEVFQKLVSIDNRLQKISLVKIVNLLGQEIDESTHGVQIHVYSDGTAVKYFK